MNPKLTDDAVAGLPLHQGRSELLEEIMRTPVLDDRPVRADHDRRRSRWAVPVVVAAAVAALVAGSASLVNGLDTGSSGNRDRPGIGGGPAAAATGDYRAVLDAPGWTVDGAYTDADYGEVFYTDGDGYFSITWNPAASYDEYVADRRRDAAGSPDGELIDVLGREARMWTYRKRDHTAIRAVDAGHWLELRGTGLSRAAYVQLLGRLRLVDQGGFESAMPSSFVDSGERTSAVDELVAGIAEQVDPLLPPGTPMPEFRSSQSDPYHLGVEVAGTIACAWLADFEEAYQAGDQARMDAAADALGTARDWPVLQETTARGDYAQVLWSYADDVVAGRLPEGYAGGLGCDR